MTGGAEGHALRDFGGVRAQIGVGIQQFLHVYQHAFQCNLSGLFVDFGVHVRTALKDRCESPIIRDDASHVYE
ncbi:hypothetical protein GCM10007862_08880 [Dyella lipolytica]|nr:hypothetical protein GCM10007862_08880 [Dyella lipolytica]